MTCKRFRLSSGFIVNLHEQSSSTARAQLEHQHRKEVDLKTYKVLRFYFIYISINPVVGSAPARLGAAAGSVGVWRVGV